MNIIVKTYSGHIITRPDTTWEKDSDDLYLPDFINSLSYSPVLYTRISKPGRSIAPRFADRYYDSFNFGVLLLPEDINDGTEEGFAAASCIDHTSFLPYDRFPVEKIGKEFRLKREDTQLFYTDGQSIADIENTICEATSHLYVRTGDLLAIELAPRKHLYSREEGNTSILGTYGNETIIDFRIVVTE